MFLTYGCVTFIAESVFTCLYVYTATKNDKKLMLHYKMYVYMHTHLTDITF